VKPKYKIFKVIDSAETGKRAREEREKYKVPWRLLCTCMGFKSRSFLYALEKGEKTWNKHHIAGFNEAVTEWRKRDA